MIIDFTHQTQKERRIWKLQSDLVALLLLPNPFRRMVAWQKTMESLKPGNFPRPGPKAKYRKGIAKEHAVQRIRSWTRQN